MAERRRRRSTECESESEHAEPQLSEYESNADESRDFVEETEEDTDEYVTEEEETAEEEEDEDGKKSVADGERQSGDGEEQPKLDIDEDRQNPAYIPKRGAFYEHDMRLDPDEEVPAEQKEERRGKGKLWKDESKWIHDKFDQSTQAPKTRQELITMYGYDITQYDQPPEEPPKMSGRPRGGGRRDRKPQFQDFLPDDKGHSNYSSNRDRYDEESYEDKGPRQSKSDTSQYRGGRGRRGNRRSEGGAPRRGYSDFKEERAPRNRTYSDQGRENRGQDKVDFRNRDIYANRDRDSNEDRDDYRNRENVGNRDRENYGNRDRDNYGNRGRDNYGNRGRDNYGNRGRDNYGNRGRDNYGNRGRDNYGNRESHDNRDNIGNKEQYEESPYGKGNRDFQDRSEGRGGFRGRGRGGFRDNRRDNRRDFGNRDNADQQSGRSNRDHANYERQYSGGRDGQNYERQNSGGRDGESQFRRQGENRISRNEPDSPQEPPRYRGGDVSERAPARSFDKPTPKSYYTLSVTDDEKLGEMEDADYMAGGVPDMNVTVTGDRRSFKDRPRPPRAMEFTQQSSVEERRDAGPPHASAGGNKHQPTLPPRLQQQQQQQERKRQKQQQPTIGDKQDSAQSRSNKRYSSQRQRTVPEGPGYTDTQISQPQEQIVSSPLQKQFQPNFSPPKLAGSVQQAVVVRPTVATQINVPPQQPTVGSPTMVISRVPLPQTMIPITSQVPPPQVRPQRPPPPAGPSPQGLGAPPPVFPPGTLPSTAMPAVSVIAAPLLNPAGLVYAAPPPAYQVPVPQFSATPQTPQPGETVRGGTTYYSQSSTGSAPSSGTTYYSPEMQLGKLNRVQVRRPKVPLPIVNPEEMGKGKGSESSKDVEDDSLETYQDDDDNDSLESGAIENEQVDFDETVDTSDTTGQESRVEMSLEQIQEGHQPDPENVASENSSENESINLEFENDNVEVTESNVKTDDRTSGEDVEIKNMEASNEESDNSEAGVYVEEIAVKAEERIADSDEESNEKMESLEATKAEASTEDSTRSSTFVVKTDVLSPTLSVSTVMPETVTEENGDPASQDAETEIENVTSGVSAMNVLENNEENVNSDGTKIAEKKGKDADESGESFEDAVEEHS